MKLKCVLCLCGVNTWHDHWVWSNSGPKKNFYRKFHQETPPRRKVTVFQKTVLTCFPAGRLFSLVFSQLKPFLAVF
jgi:hypothetical protein